jgi:acetoacetyl-CoA synthetase
MVHPRTHQIFFLGRADGVLNPSGVRFGSAEIYSVIESFFPNILDSLCVGQRRPSDHDESVLLFVQMAPNHKFTSGLARELKAVIGRELSKRHAPRHVFETRAIPQTINGKKVELPVKQIVSGHRVKASSTLANPESLEFYYRFARIEELEEKETAKL